MNKSLAIQVILILLLLINAIVYEEKDLGFGEFPRCELLDCLLLGLIKRAE